MAVQTPTRPAPARPLPLWFSHEAHPAYDRWAGVRVEVEALDDPDHYAETLDGIRLMAVQVNHRRAAWRLSGADQRAHTAHGICAALARVVVELRGEYPDYHAASRFGHIGTEADAMRAFGIPLHHHTEAWADIEWERSEEGQTARRARVAIKHAARRAEIDAERRRRRIAAHTEAERVRARMAEHGPTRPTIQGELF